MRWGVGGVRDIRIRGVGSVVVWGVLRWVKVEVVGLVGRRAVFF